VNTSLDRRAEAAAAAVRAAVADLEPASDANPPAGPRRWPALVAAVVILIAAIAGAAVLQRDDGDTVVAGANDTMRLIPDHLPDGLAPAGAADLPTDGFEEGFFDVYGRGSDEDAFRDGDVGVLVLGDNVSPARNDEESVQVRGVAGWANEEAGSASVQWEEPGLGLVALVSHTLGRDELIELADGLQRQDERLVLDPTAGFDHVAGLDGAFSALTYRMIPGSPGAAVHYQSSGQVVNRTLSIAVVADEPGLLDAFRWLGGDEARRTTVRGHDGWFLPGSDSDDFSPYLALGWRERPGVLLTAAGLGVSEDELRAAVESLRPATDEEWRRLLAVGDDEVATPEDSDSEDMPTLAGEGPWRYARDGDDGVCFEVPDPPVTSRTCSGPLDQPQLYEGPIEVDEGWWVHGRVRQDVRQVALQWGAGERVVVDTIPMSAGGLRAWAGLLPGVYPGTVTVVALAADGSELDRTTVDVQQNTTGALPSPTTSTP
jgi:hypothetical protein